MDSKEPVWARLANVLQETIKASLLSNWSKVLGLEAALEELAAEFDGEDLLKPILRADIDAARTKALNVHRMLQEWTGQFSLPDSNQEALSQTRELIRIWAANA